MKRYLYVIMSIASIYPYTLYELYHSLHSYIMPWMNSFAYIQRFSIECISSKGSALMCVALSPVTNAPIAIVENEKGEHYFSEQQLLEVCVGTLSEKFGSEQLERMIKLLVQDCESVMLRQKFMMRASPLKWNPMI